MEKSQIKIKIDANGNVHREVVPEEQVQPQRSKLLKKIATAFNFSAV